MASSSIHSMDRIVSENGRKQTGPWSARRAACPFDDTIGQWNL